MAFLPLLIPSVVTNKNIYQKINSDISFAPLGLVSHDLQGWCGARAV
jgi:hypothetical protein